MAHDHRVSLAARLLFLLAGALLLVVPARGTESPKLAQHAEALRANKPAGFTVVIEPPFVVVGDEPPAVVGERCRATIRWAVARLREDFFERNPESIIEIWLFRDQESYERTLRTRFDEKPISPFGFYSPKHQALFMNISTGSGTLVHEIVHPFMRANFPKCPAWFDEGFASLYEQCRDEDGHIVGGVNWRLPGLQERIRAGTLISFRELTSLSRTAFYGASEGYNVHYAQARYLCFYLQERGLLRKFYQAFVAGAETDPTGYATLQHVLGVEDMVAFQRDWEAFVLRRKFPE